MMGFVIGIAIAFFVAPAVFGIMWALKLPEGAGQVILNGLLVLYGALVLLFVVRGVLALMQGEADEARRRWAGAIVMATLAAVAWVSMGALEAAWP
jgi:hypothetical protein